MSSSERLLIILDVDETLLHASDVELDREPDFSTTHYAVYKRPHVEQFLEELEARYRIAVWTAATRSYFDVVAPKIFPSLDALEFIWTSEQCTMRVDSKTREEYAVKNFRKLKRKGESLARSLAIDDTPRNHEKNYGNLIAVDPWVGDVADAQLPRLITYLRTLEDAPDVRQVEKRGWDDS